MSNLVPCLNHCRHHLLMFLNVGKKGVNIENTNVRKGLRGMKTRRGKIQQVTKMTVKELIGNKLVGGTRETCDDSSISHS